MRFRPWLLVSLAIASPALARAPHARHRPATSLASLDMAIARFTPAAPGHLGVTAIDLESGARVSFAGDQRFPMASTAKIAVAATFLHQVEQGKHRLDEMIPLDEAMRVRSEGITELLPHGGVSLSALNLLELMLTLSDNTAADMLIQAVGGPQAVSAWLDENGIKGQHMDRTIARLILDDGHGEAVPGLTDAQSLARISPVEPWAKGEGNWAPNPAFDADPRDTSTPDAMADLVSHLYRGELLTAEHTKLLFDIMARCKTGTTRVAALLPPGTPWAHKTGSLVGIANDVGVLTLPNGHHLVIAVFSYGMPKASRDRLNADVGRLLYDGFLTIDAGK